MEDYIDITNYQTYKYMNTNQNWTIEAPEGATYLSDFLTEIPNNCLFNKRQTGCGATELAIRNPIPTLIAMPYVALVKNKTIYRQDDISVLGVYEGIEEQDIMEYAQSHSLLKIAVTYDSLPRTIKALQAAGLDPYNDLFLLVDEWHVLFNSYSFRHTAIKNLLAEAGKFARVTYMTATPIEREYILEELKHLPICEINWPHLTEIHVRSRQTSKPAQYIVKECRKVLDGNLPYNLHIFVNSVEFIAKVIDLAKLTPDQVKVVCSTSGDNSENNQRKLGKDYPIDQPSDPVKKINFYTSTCFEGCDLYDENGVTFIVSDGNKAHTLLDISTLFTQICGRVRDSKYKREIIHVFSTTKYSREVTLDEYVAATQKTLKEAVQYAQEINALSDKTRVKTLSKIKYINEQYVRIENNKLVVDKNLANMDIVNFKICRHIYRTYVNLSNELKRNGYSITQHSFSEIIEKLEDKNNARVTFKELFEEYHRLKTSQPFFSLVSHEELCAQIAVKYPLVKQAYEELGTAKVQALKYHVGNIRRELTKQWSVPVERKIVKMINETFAKQTSIAKSKVKMELQKIYDSLGIQQTAKATDLAKWYEVKMTSPKINGKTTACMAIIRDRIIPNEIL